MKVAVASGKGGTGKTTVAINLARVAADAGRRVQLLDCDVEEPDCALFLRPQVHRTLPVELSIPEVDEAVCTHCGTCSDVCEFHAIISLPTTVLVFPELCHSCGACTLLCPEHAITETPRRTGTVQVGHAGRLGDRGGHSGRRRGQVTAGASRPSGRRQTPEADLVDHRCAAGNVVPGHRDPCAAPTWCCW